MKRWLLGILLLPSAAFAGALTIPLDAYLSGAVDAEALLGGDRSAGWENDLPGHGSITLADNPVPGSAVQVTGLEISQQFISTLSCGVGPCPFDTFDVSLQLERASSLFIDDQGRPSGPLSVIVSTLGAQASAVFNVESIGFSVLVRPERDPLATGGGILDQYRWYGEGPFPNYLTLERVWIEARFAFNDPSSPLAGLQGLHVIPEPAILGMLALAGCMTLRRRTAMKRSAR